MLGKPFFKSTVEDFCRDWPWTKSFGLVPLWPLCAGLYLWDWTRFSLPAFFWLWNGAPAASTNFTIPVAFNEHRKSQAPIPAHVAGFCTHSSMIFVLGSHSPLGLHVDGDIATPWLTLLPSPIHMCHLFWWILWTWRFAWIFLIGWKCLNARDIPYIMYAYKYTAKNP